MHHLASTLEEPFGVCWIRLVLGYHFWTPLRQNKAVVVSTTLQLSQPRNQEEPKRNQRRNAAHYMTFLACQELLAEAECNITSRPATEPRRTQAEPRQECCSLQIVLGMSDAHSKGKMQYYQHAGTGTNRNQCRTSAGMLLIT